jgi:hypothetical protein
MISISETITVTGHPVNIIALQSIMVTAPDLLWATENYSAESTQNLTGAVAWPSATTAVATMNSNSARGFRQVRPQSRRLEVMGQHPVTH